MKLERAHLARTSLNYLPVLKSGHFSKWPVNKGRACLRPVGTVDNSPPFERWVRAETSDKVPEGRQIKAFHGHLSSLRDSNPFPPVTRR